MISTIDEFLDKNNKFSFPDIPTGTANTIGDFYKNCIYPVSPKNKDTIIKWHNLISKYSKDSDAVILSRLYESRKYNGNWDTRRGMICRMRDGFTYAYATNFFARIIYTMAYFDFVPEYDDFKTMFTQRKFSLSSFMGQTDVEKKYAAFTQTAYHRRFYTQHWYLAHIVAVNDELFYKYETKNINDIFTPGMQNEWKENSAGYFERYIDSELNESEKLIARAHFIRFIDPMNYFLVPNSKHVSISKIGEEPNLIKYMRKIFSNNYGNDYRLFLNDALSDPLLVPVETVEELGKTSIINLRYSALDLKTNITKPISKQFKNVPMIKISTTELTQVLTSMTSTDVSLIKELETFKDGAIDKGFSEKEFKYDNEYLATICFNHSNKWLGQPNSSEMEKMWSIIYKPKKTFSNLEGWKLLCRNFDISITEVTKGKNQGNYGIRIRGMKKKPDAIIVKKILDLIFDYNKLKL